MDDPRIQGLYQQYENDSFIVNPFVASKIGLQKGESLVKIDTYNIASVPFKLSMKGATMLASLSPNELVFFQRFVKGLAGLTLAFQPPTSTQIIKIFARCVLTAVSPMKGRESVGLVSMVFRHCPPDLISIVGDYMMLVDRLRVEYDDFKGKRIPINAESARMMGYNNYAVLVYGTTQTKVAMFAVASDRAEFLVPMSGPPLEARKPLQLRLYFQSYQFSVPGSVQESVRLPNGAQKVAAEMSFSAELVDIIERYRFSERFVIRPIG